LSEADGEGQLYVKILGQAYKVMTYHPVLAATPASWHAKSWDWVYAPEGEP